MSDILSSIASSLVGNGISNAILGNSTSTTQAAPAASAAVTSPTTGTPTTSTDFDTVLKSFLPADSSSNVSEEDLFSAVAGERIQTLKGDAGLAAYKSALDSEKKALTTSDGYVPMEKATINALKKLVTDGTLSKAEGDQIYTESFEGAQLDNNKAALYDGRGGANDPTIAVASESDALQKVKSFFDGLATTPIASSSLMSLASATPTGATSTNARVSTAAASAAASESGNVVPKGTFVDGSGGFLFKPVSNNGGKLAVMFDQSWTGNIADVRLLDSSGNVIENGVHSPSGTAETGREKYNFSKQGSSYSKNISVEVTFKDGAVKSYSIPDPSKRYD